MNFMNFMNLIFFVMKKIGILGFQGAIIEHERQIKAIGHEPVIVKYPEQLEEIDGIILPGGESTTMGKILNRTGLMEPLRGNIHHAQMSHRIVHEFFGQQDHSRTSSPYRQPTLDFPA